MQYSPPPPFAPGPDQGVGAPVPPAPPAVNGIPGASGMPAPPYPQPMNDPASMQYVPETQQDGSVLLRVLNPDGTPGPVVKIIPAPMGKPKK